MKKIFIGVFVLIFSIVLLLYGPYGGFRNFLITTSITTMKHQYIARFFYSDKFINKVMLANSVISKTKSNPDLINMEEDRDVTYYDKIILDRKKSDIYKLINIRGNGYKGYLVAIYNPSLVRVLTSKDLGVSGEDILSVSKREKSLVTINGGGFYDPEWSSEGGIPHGVVISRGEVVSRYNSVEDFGFIGFDKDDRLVLGKFSEKEAIGHNLRDAVEFGPFLIVDGEKSYVNGNGGYGVGPRTAIGQRRDGIVLFLVIDGRRITSIGASMVDLIDIMYKYGAYNAANLDGGSSSSLVIEQKLINHPVASGKLGLRKIPTFFAVCSK